LPTPNPSGINAEITRRRFILAASASVICAPAIVRAASLMPVRAIRPIGPQYYGWVERVFIHCLTPHLSELSRAGLSAFNQLLALIFGLISSQKTALGRLWEDAEPAGAETDYRPEFDLRCQLAGPRAG
jgi:hypothetical protein